MPGSTGILLAAFFFMFLLHLSEGERRVEHELSADSYDLLDGLGDVCSCTDLQCSCCMVFFGSFKGCTTLNLVEVRTPQGNATYNIELHLQINNKNVISNNFPLSNIQPLCFGLFGASLCGKLNVRRKMEDINICGTLQVQFLKVPVHEYDFYCFTIPHSKATSVTKEFNLLEKRSLDLSGGRRLGGSVLALISKKNIVSTTAVTSTGVSNDILRRLTYRSRTGDQV